ncbi:hypothetical protein K0C01_04980 [Salinarchaeum sp. IM2453]|uniref:DUF7845 domain-containing protein n=1 Tax=Salinarchaeum sp. IM2453 TaxID=2862870 RepID=UPI001C83A141|nr:hypothetical protein [Salinarchaeum sp. IM2453]QZA89491.1 hypothetical protein K0C01_04980 [Salinarchaeum sp. IM2453]
MTQNEEFWDQYDAAIEDKREEYEEKQQEKLDEEELDIDYADLREQSMEKHLEDRELTGTQTHEFRAHLLFADPNDKLSPYHGLRRQFNDEYFEYWYDEEDHVWIEDVCGDDWIINDSKKAYWNGGIAAEDEGYDTYDEYQIAIYADDDMAEEKTRKATLQFRPSVPDATKPDGSRIQSMPEDLPYGIRVQVNSSNVALEEIVPLIQAVADRLGLQQHYFASGKIHEWSRVYSFAVYVRLLREISEEKIVGAGKLLDRLTAFGRSRKGSRGMLKWDNEEIMGHYTAVTLCQSSWSKLIPGRMAGMRLKSYHMKNPEKATREATSHPKLELQYTTDNEYTDEYVSWEDVDQLKKQLEETLLNCLQWADVNLDPANESFVEDAYFDPQENDRDEDLDLLADPMEQVQEHEENIATLQLAQADLSDGEEEVVKAMSDGGQMHYEKLAEIADVSKSTVYRAIEKIDTIIEQVDGKIGLADEYIKDRIQDFYTAIANWSDKVGQTAEDIVNNAIHAPEGSPFAKWIKTYVGSMRDLTPRESPGVGSMQHAEGWTELVLNVQGTKDEITRILRAGGLAALETDNGILQELRKTVVKFTDRRGKEQEIVAGAKHGDAIKVGGFQIW